MSIHTGFSHRSLGYAASHQGLMDGQLRWVVVAVFFIHIGIGWGLLQIKAIREVAVEAAPMFFEVIAEPVPLPPAPTPPKAIPKVTPPAPLISLPSPVPSSFVTEPPQPDQPVDSPEPIFVQAAPAPPAPPPPPKAIPASEIRYLIPPQMVYPRASRPFRESGRVITRVYVDEAGMPRAVQVNHSSGFPRLDEAALRAVQKARFKPYTENGVPTAGWALIPLNFELE